jgi:hypothetical protein
MLAHSRLPKSPKAEFVVALLTEASGRGRVTGKKTKKHSIPGPNVVLHRVHRAEEKVRKMIIVGA